MDPITIMALSGLGSGLMGLFGAKSQADVAERENQRNRDLQIKLAQQEDQRQRDLAQQDTAASEAKADPWAQAMAQIQNMNKLDALERSSYAPVRFDMSGSPYAKYVPNISGGLNLSTSPELIAMAAAAKRAIASGQGRTPTMTNPANYGRTGGLNYAGVLDGTGGATDLSLDLPVNSALGTARAGVRREMWERRNYDR